MPPYRILFVDDEPSIRLMLPAILENKGFRVTTAATVPEALAIISAEPFDVLISDLNIGEPADGFTVVSAMRRTQPKCVNFILTGYPAFETALQAIRKHVEDTRWLDMVIYRVVQENLMALDVSRLVSDLRVVNDSLQTSLKRSLRAYLEQAKKAA